MSVRLSVCPSVRLSVCPSVRFEKSCFWAMIPNVLINISLDLMDLLLQYYSIVYLFLIERTAWEINTLAIVLRMYYVMSSRLPPFFRISLDLH